MPPPPITNQDTINLAFILFFDDTCVTFGVYRFWRAYIDGYSALGVVYEVSLEVVKTTHA